MSLVPATLCPLSLTYVFDLAGRPEIGALLTVFEAGTTQPAVAFADAALTAPLQQPIKTTGSGRFPPIYVGPGYFRYRVADPQGVILDDIDGVEGAVVTNETINITNTGAQNPTGALVHFYGTSTPGGWVRANGRTISNAVGGGTEFADSSTQALFIQIWDADPNLAVSGGRGNTAMSDYNAGKQIALPDLRRRVLAGIDGMGNGYLNGVADLYRILGAQFGEEVHVLSLGEMPSHSHVLACDTEGGHIHGAASDIQGVHSHGASADLQGLHAHGASADQQGSHTHATNVGSAGAHAHTFFEILYNADFTAQVGSNANVRATQTGSPASTDTQGQHVHQVDIIPGGQHAHNITVNPDGQHTHNIAVNASGAHQHNISIADAGEHTHVVTAQAVGGSGGHNNLQPTMPVTVLIKL